MTKITLNKWFNRYLRLILGLLLFLSISPDSPAAEIHVPAQFSTIQAAIDASADNDIIVVDPGLYTENIDFNGKGITVRSTNPLDSTVVAATVIDGNRNGSVVTFNSGETRDSVLSGFTIRNGIGTLLDGKRYGGGIYCGGQATPTIRFNRIINNSADIGGGLYIHGNSSPTITDGPKADYPYAGIGQILHLSVTAADPDNEPLSYRWVSREGGTITGTGRAVTFSANTAGVYPIDLTVDDQHGGLATGTVTVTIIGVTIQTASMPQLSTGNPVTLKAAVTPTIADSAQYPLSITWSLTEGPATGSFDAAVNGTPQATSIIFTPTGSGPGRLQAAYRVGTATSSNSISIALNPIAVNISLTSGLQETTVQAVISGNNLSRVNGLSLGGSGVSGTIQSGKTENSLSVQLVIAKEAAPGNRPIILTTPEGQFNTLLTFQIKALPAITANPTSLNLTVGDTGGLTFSIPDPAPTGGLTLTLSSSAPIVATVPPSIIIPEGQQSLQVNVIAIGVGSTTITANAPSYSKAQVPITVINPPLITFSPSPLNLAKGLVETCTVNVSNPAPTGGLVVTLSGASGNIDIPATVTIAEAQTSATFIATGLAVGTVTLAAQAPGYPGANWPVTVTTAQFNLFPGYLPIAVGRSSTLILSVPNKTPAGGLTVNLSSSNTALVTTPATVTIPEGQKSTSVPVNGVGVGSAVITSALTGFQSAQATVNVLQVYNISFVPNALFLTPGTSQSTDVVISSPAPAGGLTITFNNPSPDKITGPPAVFIAEGQFKTTITISALDTTTVPITLTASSPGLTDGTLTVTLQPKLPTWIKANVTVGAGCRTTGGVGLTGTTAPTGGYTVNLSSSDPSIASVPATVTIPAGSGNSGFTIVGVSPGTAQITISASGFSATNTVTVVKPTFSLGSLSTQMTLGASTSTSYIYTNVPGGTYWFYFYDNYQSNATNQAVNQSLTVSLSSSNAAVLQVPATVTITAGNYYVTGFAIQAVGTGSSTITVSAPNWDSVTSGAISVVGPWLKANVTVGAGCRTSGGVGLTGTTAPPDGYTVNLSSSDPSIATVPATVTIPSGSSRVIFTIGGVSPGTAQITISAGGFSATNTVTVVKPTFNLSNWPTQMTLGAGATSATITTNIPGGTYYSTSDNNYQNNATWQAVNQPLTVSLSSSNGAVLQVPGTVIIAAGNYSVTGFAIQAVGTGSGTITASAPNWNSVTSPAISVVGPWLKANVTVGAGCRTSGGIGLTGTTAPTGGYTVNLSSSDPSIATVPATVTIPSGSSRVIFTIVGVSPGTAQITLSAGGFSATSTVTVVRPTFNLSNWPTQITLGAGATSATITTNIPGGTYYSTSDNNYQNNSTWQAVDQTLTVNLSSSNAAVLQVPATVTMAAGNYSLTGFAIQAVGTGSGTITAGAPNWNSVTSPAISVVGPWIKASVTVGAGCRTSGGVGLTGTTAPTGGYTVTLSSSDPSIASAPATVTIPSGSNRVEFTIVGVSPGTAQITISAGGFSATNTVTVVKPTFNLSSWPTQMTLGASATSATITTNIPGGTMYFAYNDTYMENSTWQAVNQPLTVSLSSFNGAVLQVPTTVTIAAGNYSVTGFAIQAVGTGSSTITASAPNWGSAISAAISVVGPWIKANVTVGAGCLTIGGVGLTGTTAPIGGYTVNLISSNPSIATVPATVTIPSGSNRVEFTIVGVSPGTAQITISAGGFSATNTVTVVKPTFNLSSWPTQMTLGAGATSAIISTNVPGGNRYFGYNDTYMDNSIWQAVNQTLTVSLSSENPTVIQVPAIVTIAAGNYYVTNFAIQAVGTGSSTITASSPNWNSATCSVIFVP